MITNRRREYLGIKLKFAIAHRAVAIASENTFVLWACNAIISRIIAGLSES